MKEDEREIGILVGIVQNSPDHEERKVAIAAIRDKLQPFRHSLARQFANKGVEFDDIVQQIELKMIEAMCDYDMKKDPSALRHIISKARNGVWNYYRKQMNYFKEEKMTLSLDGGYFPEESQSNHKHGLAIIGSMQDESWNEDSIIDRIIVEEELAKLTPHQRDVLSKYFVEDKTQYDIAEELNINQANVSRAKKRAIKQLRNGIEGTMHEDDSLSADE